MKMPLDLGFQLGGFGRAGIEHDVTASDERGDVAKTELGKKLAQVIHLDRAPADVDGAEQSNVSCDETPHGFVASPHSRSNSPDARGTERLINIALSADVESGRLGCTDGA